VPGSQNWAPFSKMAVQMEQRMAGAYLPVCIANGRDGVGIGFLYSLVPRRGDEVAGKLEVHKAEDGWQGTLTTEGSDE
jgi:hypothetical protein